MQVSVYFCCIICRLCSYLKIYLRMMIVLALIRDVECDI